VIITEDQARTVLRGLGNGWYSTAELWPRYLELIGEEVSADQERGRRISLGMALKRVSHHQKYGSLYLFRVGKDVTRCKPGNHPEMSGIPVG
jgi:hypothetical protein